MPKRKSKIDAQTPEAKAPRPDEPLQPIDGGDEPPLQPPGDQPPPGNGGDEPPVRITRISPIAGPLTGGIEVTLTGTGFQPGAEVYFGSSPSPEVTYETSTTLRAKLPPATAAGSVSVSLVNTDGTTATRPGGFTYIATEPGTNAEVLGVTPLSVIEDTETEVTIRGRNLIAAYNEGLVALRGPTRVHVTNAPPVTKRDEATGIEELIFTVRITATPPLAPLERIAIQVLASRRAAAQSDGVVESSRQMFTVLPRAIPVPIAFTRNLNPTRPTLVLVAGRNLEGCSLDVGGGATVHLQRSDERTVSGIVSVPENLPKAATTLKLSLLSNTGGEVAGYEMSVEPGGDSMLAAAEPGEGAASDVDEPVAGDLSLTLTPVPEQQMIGPTEEDSAVFNLRGEFLSDFFFNWFNFQIEIVNISFVLTLVNEVHLIPFFDGGGTEVLEDSPVVAEVGKLFRLRGVGLLIALQIDVVIQIRVVLIIGFSWDFWDFGFFNEFSDLYPWAIGSIVVSVRVIVRILFRLSFLIALVQPGGRLRILFSFNLELGIDFTLSTDGQHLQFGTRFRHRVRHDGIGPLASNLFPCDGRFQLAEENGRTVFTDSFGGTQSFYFPRAAGQCCLPWNFDLQLVRFEEGGPEETVQQSFRTEYCLNAAPSPNLVNIIITSEHPEPEPGFPPRLVLDFEDRAFLKVLATPVDALGRPTGAPRQDVRDLGYDVEFYLESTKPDVLNPTLLPPGDAVPILVGENVIHARLFPRRGEAQFFAFWPDSIFGFVVSSLLDAGLLPGYLGGTLPVTVNAPVPGTITVDPTIAYRDEEDSTKLIPVATLERNEPFEPQREYVLAARLNFAKDVPRTQTLTFTVSSVQLPPPLANIPNNPGFERDREIEDDPTKFFTGKLAVKDEHGTLEVTPQTDLSKLLVVKDLTILPNTLEVGPDTGPLTKLVPPGRAVANRDVKLSIKLDVKSSDAAVRLRKSVLDVTVGNDETFEEYLRVFQEVRKIMSGSVLENFVDNFDADVSAHKIDVAKIREELKKKGETLWTNACTEVKTKRDDRPLYWARLQCVAALRAYFKRKKLSLTDELIHTFEWPSRGLDVSGGIVFDQALAGKRKAIVTGFDPFSLPSEPNRGNPSGLVALALNESTHGSGQAAAFIRTAVIPVRYQDFNDGLIELLIKPSIDSIVLLMTTSENSGSHFYDVERWAGRHRVDFVTDNNNRLPQQIPGTVPGGEYVESTLPYEYVITSPRMLPGPKGDTPFVIDQSYLVAGFTDDRFVNRRNPKTPNTRVRARFDPLTNEGEFRPEPLLDDEDKAAFTKRPDRPAGNSDEGSGGSYLSNEIFYRTAVERNRWRPSLASGHFHVPPFVVQPTPTADQAKQQRERLITGVQTALKDFLDTLFRLKPRITGFTPRSARPGGWVTISGENLGGAVDVRIGGGSVSFHVEADTQIRADITDDAQSGFIEVETRFGTAVSAERFIVVRRFPPELLSQNLRARRFELGLTQRAAAQQMGIKAGTYANWERGRDEPRVGSFPAIITFLGHDPNPEAQTIPERIREKRESEGISQRELAERLGVAASTVKAWEADAVSRPTLRVTRIFEEYVKEA